MNNKKTNIFTMCKNRHEYNSSKMQTSSLCHANSTNIYINCTFQLEDNRSIPLTPAHLKSY